MKKLRFSLLLIVVLAGKLSFAQSSATIRAYIETYKNAAIQEEIRSGVPAAITLAQGIHETGAGQSKLVLESNNHFGIKCKSNWTGETVYHDDDAKGECFRKYSDPVDSYKDHSDFLATRPNYAALFKLDPTDYKGWAYGLKKAGYATNPKYPQILIKLIEDFNLQDYTLIALGKKPAEQEVWASNNGTQNTTATPAVQKGFENVVKPAYPNGVFTINDTRVVYITKGTPFLVVAQQQNITLSRLFEFNEIEPIEAAEYDQLVYLQRKRKTGAHPQHVVRSGETLWEIAQEEGIRFDNLLELNHLAEDMQPEVGETLQLASKASGVPRLVAAVKHMFTGNTSDKNETTVKEQKAFENVVTHTVQPKETVYSIAKRYTVSVDDVMKWNNLQSSNLKTGQQLRIIKKAANVSYQGAR